MPLTINSALQVDLTWSGCLGQQPPEISFNNDYSMPSARMPWFHWILHLFTDITLHLQIATDLRWKRFCLVSYHIEGNASWSMLSRLKKQKIQNTAFLQPLYVLGQIPYSCWIISEHLQFGTKHVMTLPKTPDCCAFSPFLWPYGKATQKAVIMSWMGVLFAGWKTGWMAKPKEWSEWNPGGGQS